MKKDEYIISYVGIAAKADNDHANLHCSVPPGTGNVRTDTGVDRMVDRPTLTVTHE